MTLLLSCQDLSKSIGSRTLFQGLSITVSSNDRIGLIGPNGTGKSTLLKILAGLEVADSGTLAPKKGLTVGYLPQTCDFPDKHPKEILLEAIKENLPDYEKELLAETWLSKLQFKGDETSAATLSGGWKKRLGLAVMLINAPHLVLLDEPTNHLDLDGVLWLEKFLAQEAPAYILVSHDRFFLQSTVNRVIELDPTYPEGMFAIDGSYSFFLSKKEDLLQGQLQRERSLASKARRESAWLRAGVKARTTKSRSRKDAAEELLDEHANVRSRNLKRRVGVDFVASERETRKLLVAKNIAKKMGERTLFDHLDFTLSPGTRLGLMGPNGSGKTTLLRLIADEIKPDQGTLKPADDLKVVYFDQHRAQLPSDITLRDALSPDGDYVNFCGQAIHVNGWCKRFLFSPDILGMPIGSLSGGERARVSIACLMLQPADILLLDEPTNDLDIPTLETFEESLLDFPGAVVLITHDRCMLDRICNTLLALGDPLKNTFYADYHQWERTQKQKTKPKEKKAPPPPKKRLSYNEKKELQEIGSKIEKLEGEVDRLNQLIAKPEIAEDPQKLTEHCDALGLAQNQIEQLFLRWEELDQKQR